ncbi:hypothetical protein N473_17070 [Pseudoalteromonas luteoviolacea CPMOR-1]|uniref:Uncharacterized protein n=1 Tax=Pseudoalteromonas luteoviolacea CPMOR-1 TaxID=1365248 RepID=A0A162BKN3_9GAMM|nr:hypothetical protein N473_17070 [Pseudoalteromonas luteoviolacea CPMOR-1]
MLVKNCSELKKWGVVRVTIANIAANPPLLLIMQTKKEELLTCSDIDNEKCMGLVFF